MLNDNNNKYKSLGLLIKGIKDSVNIANKINSTVVVEHISIKLKCFVAPKENNNDGIDIHIPDAFDRQNKNFQESLLNEISISFAIFDNRVTPNVSFQNKTKETPALEITKKQEEVLTEDNKCCEEAWEDMIYFTKLDGIVIHQDKIIPIKNNIYFN